jgi:hypothetical protein
MCYSMEWPIRTLLVWRTLRLYQHLQPKAPGVGVSELIRLALDFRTGELVARCLYRSQDWPQWRTAA